MMLSESARHWIGNEPEQEGLPEDNPFTDYSGFDGPGSCSLDGQGLPAYAVNTANRGLVIRDVLFRSSGLGPAMTLGLTYNAEPSRAGMFGRGWSFDYEASVDAQCGVANLRKGSGQGFAFSGTLCPAASLAYPVTLTAPVGIFDTMTRYADRFEYRRKESRQTSVFSTAIGDRWLLGAVRDRNGNALAITRDTDGVITAVTDAAGRTARFSYDANRRCTSIDAPDGRQASFTYDGNGNLLTSRDLAGNLSTYTYNTDNFLVSMTTAGKTTAFAYDPAGKGNIASVTDALGKVWGYAVVGGEVRITDPLGGVTAYANVNGRTSSVRNPLNQTASVTYNSQRLPQTITDPRGKVTSLEYDSAGNITRQTDPNGAVTVYAYDADANLTAITDPLGNVWSATYDAHGNRDSATTPLGRSVAFAYDTAWQLAKATLPDGGFYAFNHDAFGNVTSVTDPDGNATALAYDAAGLNLTSRTDPRGKVTTFQYDDNRRLVRETPPDGGARTYGYDCCALSSVTNGNGHAATIARDALLNVVRRTDALGHHADYTYNDRGNLTAWLDKLGHATTYGRDAAGRLASKTNPLGKTVTLERDAAGHPTSVTDARANVTSLTYDDLGLFASQRDPLNNVTAAVVRDVMGRPLSVTGARGDVVSVLRDADGRITAKKHDNAVIASYAYDAVGRLQSVADATGTKTFTRTRAGRVASIDYPDGKTLGLSYDAAGNVASMTYPDGLVVTYHYNGRNLPVQVDFAGKSLQLAYDAAGNLTGETRSNGMASTYGYDAAERLTGIAHKKGASVLADIVYARDAVGNITAASGSWPLTPRLGTSRDQGTYDAANGLTAWGGQPVATDADGNVTSIGGARALSASYDPENRPISIVLGGTTRTYAYNGLGERVRVVSGATTRHAHHDPFGRVAFETNAAGQVTLDAIYAGDRLVASGTVADGFVFHHQDVVGNTLALTDASGATAGRFAYAPYGAVTNASGRRTPFTFVGAYGVMDEGDGLFFMRNRYYDAVTGRFLQRDPIGFAGGLNRYAYADGNPVLKIDPNGTMGFVPFVIGGAVIISYVYNAYGTAEHVSKGAEKAAEAYYGSQNAADALQRVGDNIQRGIAENNYDTCKTQEEKLRQPLKQRKSMSDVLDSWFGFTEEASDAADSAAEAAYRGARAAQEMSGMNKLPSGVGDGVEYVIQNAVTDKVDQSVAGE